MDSDLILKLECVDDKNIVNSSHLRVCRVCFSADTNLLDLHSNNLAEELSELTGTAVKLGDGLPQQLCAICCALLRKGSAFRKKCRTAYFTLLDVLARHLSITAHDILTLPSSHLKTPLTKSAPYVVDIQPEKQKQSKTREVTDKKITRKSETRTKRSEPKDAVPDIKPDPDVSQTVKVDDDSKIFHITIDPLSEAMRESDFNTDIYDDSMPVNTNSDAIPDTVKPEPDLSKPIKDKERDKPKRRCVKKKIKKEEVIEDDDIGNDNDFDYDGEAGNSSDSGSVYSDDSLIDQILSQAKNLPKSKKTKVKKERQQEATEKKYNVEIIYLSKEEQLRDFEARKESIKYKEATFKCEYCYKGFTREMSYKNHMEVHDPNAGKKECDLCHTYFDSDWSYRSHMNSHRKRFKCKAEFCNFITNSTSQATLHYNWHNGATFECERCGKVYNKKSTYMTHLRKLHGSTFCNICNEPFLGEQGLKSHMMKAHRKEVEYRCSACGVQFLSDSALHRHVAAAPTSGCKELSPCEHCGLNNSNEQMLLDHLQQEHNIKLRCDLCGITFKIELLYKKHCYKLHGGDKPVENTIYARPRRLPKMNYMCEVCGRYFQSNALLSIHQRSHNGEKPFQCSICAKRFSVKMTLKVHMNIHTGEKPYKCPHCHKGFTCNNNRSRHVREVHMKVKGKLYACHICGKSYTANSSVKMHIRTAHMKEPWPKRARHRNERDM